MSEAGPEDLFRRPETEYECPFVKSMPLPSIMGPAATMWNYYLLVLHTDKGMLVSIKPDGEIERGPAFTTEHEASLSFWRILGEAMPDVFEQAGLRVSDQGTNPAS